VVYLETQKSESDRTKTTPSPMCRQQCGNDLSGERALVDEQERSTDTSLCCSLTGVGGEEGEWWTSAGWRKLNKLLTGGHHSTAMTLQGLEQTMKSVCDIIEQ